MLQIILVVVYYIMRTKILKSAKNRSQEAFKWVAEVPGDLHTKGYLCEAAYKAQKSGVFMHVVNKVMKRPKVTDEVFGQENFSSRTCKEYKRWCYGDWSRCSSEFQNVTGVSQPRRFQ